MDVTAVNQFESRTKPAQIKLFSNATIWGQRSEWSSKNKMEAMFLYYRAWENQNDGKKLDN